MVDKTLREADGTFDLRRLRGQTVPFLKLTRIFNMSVCGFGPDNPSLSLKFSGYMIDEACYT